MMRASEATDREREGVLKHGRTSNGDPGWIRGTETSEMRHSLPSVEVTQFRAAWREKGRHWERRGAAAGVLQALAAVHAAVP